MKNYINPYFSVSVTTSGSSINLIQKVLNSKVNTRYLPNTCKLLHQYVPEIFLNKCYNNAQLPFRKEVVKTEIGHLFEHLIIEFMKQYAEHENGYGAFSGETSWDWSKEEFGTFNISITAEKKDFKFFHRAFKKACEIVTRLYEESSVENSKGELKTHPKNSFDRL